MRKSILLTALMAVMQGVLSAALYLEPGDFALRGEFLALYPSIESSAFVVNSSSSSFQNGNRIYNPLGFNLAGRLEGIYEVCNRQDIRARWTYLHADSHKKVNGANLFPTTGFGITQTRATGFNGTADSNIDLLYQNVELLFGQQFLFDCPFDLFLRGGLDYTYFRKNEQVFYSGVLNAEWQGISYFWGLGPEFAVEALYPICEWTRGCPGFVSLNVLTSASLLVSKMRTNLLLATSNQNPVIKDKGVWTVIPSWYARIGLDFEPYAKIRCASFVFEIGYEFATYFHAVSNLVMPNSQVSSSNEYRNFSAQGPFVGLSVVF